MKIDEDKKTEFMSREEAVKRNKKLKGYQYVPDLPSEEAPLPLKRERKKVQYNDFVDAPKLNNNNTPNIPITNNNTPNIQKKSSSSRPSKRPKLDDEVIQSLNYKKKELEEKLSLLNQDLAVITERLNSKDTKRQADKVTKSPGTTEPKYSELSDDDDDLDENYTKKSKSSRKTVSRGNSRKKTTPKKKPTGKATSVSEPRPKRNARKSFPDYTSEANSLSSFAACKKILSTLIAHRFAFPFLQPVDPVALKIPDYPLVIKHPMDFGTIKSNLEKGVYETVDEFVDHVNLVFDNACTYNPPGSDVFIMAQTLREIFNTRLPTALETSEIVHTPTRGITYRTPSPLIRTPVTQEYSELKKSVDSIKKELEQLLNDKKAVLTAATVVEKEEAVPMTREEKKRLSNDINNLASEHLTVIVKIIKQKMPSIAEGSDEIVIDIDALDTTTLRELELYVQKVKKRKGNRRPGRPTGGQKSTSPMDKLEQAKKTEEVTAQKMQDVKRRLEELSHKTASRNGIKNNTSFSLANQDLKLENPAEDLLNEMNAMNDDDKASSGSESESESGSESGSESESDNSESDSESESENDSDSEKKYDKFPNIASFSTPT